MIHKFPFWCFVIGALLLGACQTTSPSQTASPSTEVPAQPTQTVLPTATLPPTVSPTPEPTSDGINWTVHPNPVL